MLMPTKRGYLRDTEGLFIAKVTRELSAATRREFLAGIILLPFA